MTCVQVRMNYDDCAERLPKNGTLTPSWLPAHETALRDGEKSYLTDFLRQRGSDIARQANRNKRQLPAARPFELPLIEIEVSDEPTAFADQCAVPPVITVTTGLMIRMLQEAVAYSSQLYPSVKAERLRDLVHGGSDVGAIEAAALATVAREYRKSITWVVAHELGHIWFDPCSQADEGRADRFGVVMVQEVFLRNCDLPTIEDGVEDWMVERFIPSSESPEISAIAERALGRSGGNVALGALISSGFRERGARTPLPQRVDDLERRSRSLTSTWFSVLKHDISAFGGSTRFLVLPSTGCPCFRELKSPY